MYSVIEQKIIDEFINHFSEVDANTVSTSLDEMLTNVFSGEKRYGILVEFNGANKASREPFKRMVWTINVDCILFIRLSDSTDMETIEDDLRVVINKMFSLFSDNPRLDGTVAKVELIDIGRPEPSKVNDIPFYVLPFIIEVILPPQ